MTRSGRVLLLSTQRGAGSGAYRMLEYFLAALGPERRQILVSAPEDSGVADAARAAGVECLPWPAPRDTLVAHWRAAGALALPPDIRAVHAWHSRGFEIALRLARRLGVPATATLHDHPVQTAHGRARRMVMRLAARRCDALVSVGRTLAEAWRPYAGTTPITVIPNGLPDAPPAPPALSDGPLRLVFAGLHSPQVKGWPVVRDWIAAARAEGCPVRWKLYGGNPAGVGVDAQVQAFGFVDPARVWAEADLLLHPSQWFDSYPTLLVEAARAGVPTLTSNAGGSAEIVRDGVTGWVFDRERPEQGWARLRGLIAGPRAVLSAAGAAAREAFLAHHRAETMVAAYFSFWAGRTGGAG
jgi:glycosyltransferase involved in cell wall biosynthesis